MIKKNNFFVLAVLIGTTLIILLVSPLSYSTTTPNEQPKLTSSAASAMIGVHNQGQLMNGLQDTHR